MQQKEAISVSRRLERRGVRGGCLALDEGLEAETGRYLVTSRPSIYQAHAPARLTTLPSAPLEIGCVKDQVAVSK